MKKKSYYQLSIHERINLRSGFDIPIRLEGIKTKLHTYINGILVVSEAKYPCCRYRDCLFMTEININCCQEVYNIDRFYISLRTHK